VRSTLHDLVVILSPDCDLTWDHDMRFVEFQDERDESVIEIDQHSNTVSHVLVCHLQSRREIRPRFKSQRTIWERVEGNQDERYHQLPAAPIGTTAQAMYLHELYLDFKKAMSLVTDDIYGGILSGDVERIALLPAYYIHDLIHRFYGFLSRVAIP